MTEPNKKHPDVRMRGFARRTTVADALEWLARHSSLLDAQPVALGDSAGRVLAADVTSPTDVPRFARSMMDGFALRASDTLGASPYNRLPLTVVGESMPGRPFERPVNSGQAVRIMTGAPLPQGADAVLPVELVEVEAQRIFAQGSVAPGQHVGQVGEDVVAGAVVLEAGRVLRPQDIGVLSSIGQAQVTVTRKPRVRIVVTGNELLPAGSKPEPHKIVDSNGPMLAALIARDSGVADHPGIVRDRPEAILEALRSEADVVLVSGGSSVGQEDYAPTLVSEHGRLAIHGVAMRPGSPMGMGHLDDRLVFLLPGNPAACLFAYDIFAGRAIRAMGGLASDWPYRRTTAPLARKIVSTVGRFDQMRVRLTDGQVEPLAVGGSSVLTSTTRADGFVLIPPDKEGYPPGTLVEVLLYG